jgi:hypothetical protein
MGENLRKFSLKIRETLCEIFSQNWKKFEGVFSQNRRDFKGDLLSKSEKLRRRFSPKIGESCDQIFQSRRGYPPPTPPVALRLTLLCKNLSLSGQRADIPFNICIFSNEKRSFNSINMKILYN